METQLTVYPPKEKSSLIEATLPADGNNMQC